MRVLDQSGRDHLGHLNIDAVGQPRAAAGKPGRGFQVFAHQRLPEFERAAGQRWVVEARGPVTGRGATSADTVVSMVGVRGFTGWLGVVLGSPDPPALAEFYQRLLGWEISSSSSTWVDMLVRDSDGRATSSNLAFQLEKDYEPPVWPSRAGTQQMQFHLDVGVIDVDAAVEDALAMGATLADYQPQDDVRVMLDPDGHPFCLYEDRAATT